MKKIILLFAVIVIILQTGCLTINITILREKNINDTIIDKRLIMDCSILGTIPVDSAFYKIEHGIKPIIIKSFIKSE